MGTYVLSILNWRLVTRFSVDCLIENLENVHPVFGYRFTEPPLRECRLRASSSLGECPVITASYTMSSKCPRSTSCCLIVSWMMDLFLWTVLWMVFGVSTSIAFTVCCTCVLSTSCVILVREEHWAVGATSKFVLFTLSVCPIARANGILSCVDAVVQFFRILPT